MKKCKKDGACRLGVLDDGRADGRVWILYNLVWTCMGHGARHLFLSFLMLPCPLVGGLIGASELDTHCMACIAIPPFSCIELGFSSCVSSSC